jgi:hypothetical protein
MKEEYIIISKTKLLGRIEELKNYFKEKKLSNIESVTYNHSILEIKQILSQSNPLIPVVEDAFREGSDYGGMDKNYVAGDYSGNLKIKF